MYSILFQLLLLMPVEADAPKVTLSPDTIAEAESLEANIDKVVLYGDRGVVHRKATKTLSAGVHTIRFPNLSSTVSPDSIRLEMKGATLLRLDTRVVQTEDYSTKEITDIVKQLETLQLEWYQLGLEKNSYAHELNLLQQVNPNGLIDEDYTNNIAQYSLPLWKQNWTFIGDKIDELQKEQQRVDTAILDTRTKYDRLMEESRPILQGNATKSTLEVVAVVEVKATKKTTFDLTYTVQGARWTPVYDVHYDSKTDEARIESAALVVQTSGENWEGVNLEFATANRQSYRSLPNLLTWTLGEKNEYIPQARPANHRQNPPLYPPFSSQQSKSELDSITSREVYMGELKHLQDLSNSLAALLPSVKTPAQQYNSLVGPQGMISTGAYGAAAPPRSVSQVHTKQYEERVDYQYEVMAEEDMMAQGVILDEMVVAESIQRAPGLAVTSMARKSAKKEYADSSVQVANIPLALEASNLYAPIRYHNNQFNISEAQSLNLLWKSPGTFSIPSDGQQHRIPLQSLSHTATSYYEATPSLEEIAYLKGAVENTDTQAILQGNANIFLNGHYTVESRLNTTKAGGLLELPLGADENIRIKRNITPMQRKEGILKQQDITDYSVTIEIGNYKQKPIAIRVLDQIPVTQNDEITIEYLEASHPFEQKEKNHQGILYWDLEIPAGQTETIELSYSISRPKNWKLWGN